MTTPNSSAPTVDINVDQTASDEFGTNVGQLIGENIGFVADTDRRNWPQSVHCNVGRSEQKFRLGAGAALLAAAAFAPVSSGWRVAFAVLAAAELITGTTRYCPVSHALGINTCRGDER